MNTGEEKPLKSAPAFNRRGLTARPAGAGGRAVALHRQAMIAAGRDGGHSPQPSRDAGFSKGVTAPRHDRAVALQRQTVEKVRAGSDGGHSAQPSWDVGLSKDVTAPRHNRAVALQRQAVVVA